LYQKQNKVEKIGNFLEGFEPVSEQNEVENCWLTKSNGWVGRSKSSIMDCLQQQKIIAQYFDSIVM
jgi:hypothetical protein